MMSRVDGLLQLSDPQLRFADEMRALVKRYRVVGLNSEEMLDAASTVAAELANDEDDIDDNRQPG